MLLVAKKKKKIFTTKTFKKAFFCHIHSLKISDAYILKEIKPWNLICFYINSLHLLECPQQYPSPSPLLCPPLPTTPIFFTITIVFPHYSNFFAISVNNNMQTFYMPVRVNRATGARRRPPSRRCTRRSLRRPGV